MRPPKRRPTHRKPSRRPERGKSASNGRQSGNKAIVLRTPAVPDHRYDVNRDQIDLIKRTVAKGATDDELQLFLLVAKKHRLDPFTRQLHLIRRWSEHTLNGIPDPKTGKEGKGCYIATIQIGIDGFRQMASRYPDFGATSEAEYGPDTKDGVYTVPTWARIKVFKKGLAEPTVGTAYWQEYSPDMTQNIAFMWKKMPRHMLAKCAEALALRKAFPDLADIYTTEEMAQHDQKIAAGEMPAAQTVAPGVVGASESEQKFLDRQREQINQLPIPERQKVEAMNRQDSRAATGDVIDIQPKAGTPERTYVPESGVARPLASEMRNQRMSTEPNQAALTWDWDERTSRATIDGPRAVREKAWPMLKEFWKPELKRIVVNGDQLEGLKYLLPRAGYAFVQRRREPGE